MAETKSKVPAVDEVRSKETNEILKSNNKRALVIHFLLSIVGFTSFLILTIAIDSMGSPYWATMAIFYFVVVCGLWVYFLCGYFFLRPNCEKAYLSVDWLAVVTVTTGVVSAIGFMFYHYQLGQSQDTGLPFALSSFMLLLPFFLNTLGFGIAAVAGTVSDPPLYGIAVGVLSTLALSVLPPGLLWLGLKLRMRADGTEEPTLDDNCLNGEGVHG